MKRRPLLDINVLLDVLGQREPFVASAAQIWSVAESGRIAGLISADSFSTIYYLLRQGSSNAAARRGLRLLQSLFEIIPVDSQIIAQALESQFSDFEDAIQYLCAVRGQADCIVTRDLRGFGPAELPVLTPDEFLRTLKV